MENARAAKNRRPENEWNQVRVRSGSKGRDNTRLKHGSIQTKEETKAYVSEEQIVS